MSDLARTQLLSRFSANNELQSIPIQYQDWEARDTTKQYKRLGLAFRPEEAETITEIMTREDNMPDVREMQEKEVVYLEMRQYEELTTFTMYYVI